MSEINRINIVDLLSQHDNLLQTTHQKNDNTKIIFKNLLFPYAVTIHELTLNIVETMIELRSAFRGNIVFINCQFDQPLIISSSLMNFEFEKCTIEKLELENINHQSEYPYKFKFITSEINNIIIENCYFKDRFYINPQYRDVAEHINRIENLLIQDTVFSHNFKLHNCEVQQCNINNTDFEKNADFFKSKFLQSDDLILKSLNFKGLALFGECEFKPTLRLEYVTFEGLSHFRQAKFRKGLDLDKANIEKEMNFYDAKGLESEASKTITSQETYRIIKHNFSKIGNQIEANKFHKLELEKRANYLQQHKKDYFAEWIVFFAHKITSNMGRSWFRPLVGIVIIGMLTNGYLNYKFSLDGHLSWQSIKHYIDHTFEFMSIISEKKQFNSNDNKTIYWLMFLNKVMLGYLYYQFVTAVRKDTTQK